MKLTFAQFERATRLLENAPENISDEALLESGITRDDLEKINEGILGDIFGGIFKKFGDKIRRMIPGSVLKKADNILDNYAKNQEGLYSKLKNERDKIYKASIEAENGTNIDKKRYDEIKIRSEKAIAAIEEANKGKIDAIEKQLQLLAKDQNDAVKNYIDVKLAEIKEKIADKNLKDAKDFADEAGLEKLEKEAADAKKRREDAEKALQDELNKKKEKEVKKEEKKKEKEAAKTDAEKKAAEAEREKDPNNPKFAKAGETWKTENGHKVEILSLTKQVNKEGKEIADLNPDSVYVKNVDSGNMSAVKRGNLKEVINKK